MSMLGLRSLESDLIQTLHNFGVRFVIVGGVAVRFHGHDREVKDLDILSEPTPENAARLIPALGEFFPRHNRVMNFTDEQQRKLESPYVKMPLWSEQDFVGIEFLTSIAEVSFDEAYDQAIMHEELGLKIPILSIDHLVLSKRAVPDEPEKHRSDIEELLALVEQDRRT